MRSVVVAAGAVAMVVILFFIGIFVVPGAALAGFCVMPFAFFFLGWAMRGAGLSFQWPIHAADTPIRSQKNRGPQI